VSRYLKLEKEGVLPRQTEEHHGELHSLYLA
jgi:hypothetical protein